MNIFTLLHRSLNRAVVLAVFPVLSALFSQPAMAADEAESWLGLPVTYTERGYGFNPWPGVELKGLRIMTSDAIVINRAWVLPDWAEWISGARTNRVRVDADEIVAKPAALARLGLADGRSTRVVTLMRFNKLRLKMLETELVLPAGQMEFSPDGTLSHIKIDLEQGISIDAMPKDGVLQLLVQVGNWKWDIFSALRFENVVAQGAVSDTGIVLDKIGGTADGGSMSGRLNIDMGAEYVLAGEFKLGNLRSPDVLGRLRPKHTVTGMLAADIKMSSKGATLAELPANLSAKGNYVLLNGTIDRLGLLDGMKRDGGGPVGGGSVRFDKMSGSFSGRAGQAATVTIQRLESGAFSATGNFVVMPDGGLKGGMSGHLRLPGGEVMSRSFSLSGKVDAPSLSARN